jgi:hypothetical protein
MHQKQKQKQLEIEIELIEIGEDQMTDEMRNAEKRLYEKLVAQSEYDSEDNPIRVTSQPVRFGGKVGLSLTE